MKRKKRESFEDDGRVVAPMNIEGMPWYAPPREEAKDGAPVTLTRSESRAAAAGVLKAALLIAAVFAVGFFLFILFCTNIWFS